MQFVPSSFVLAIIAFLILYFLLNRYAFGPLFGIMEQRTERVVGQLKSAEEDRKAANALLEEQKAALEQARKDAYDIIEQARQTSARQTDDILRQAKEEASRMKEDALKDIETEKNKAVVALRSQVSAMSVMIASKIIEKQVDEKSQEKLITQYLDEVGGKL